MQRIVPVALYYALNAVFQADGFSILITLPLLFICCFNLAQIEEKYISIHDIIWFITFIFFVVAPCQRIDGHYIAERGPVSGIYFPKWDMFMGVMIPTVFFAAATVGSLIFKKKPADRKRIDFFLSEDKIYILLVVNVIACAAYIVLSGGLGNALASRAAKVREDASILATGVLCVQQISNLFICIIFRTDYRDPHFSAQRTMAVIISLLLLVVVANPFNTPRFALIVAWFPIVFVMLKGRIPVVPFYLLMLFGMLVLMPIFSLTSRTGVSIGEALENVNVSEKFFSIPYIDVFDMLSYEIGYLADDSYYFGMKTLGVLLFFVPRSIWAGKPTLIGLDMGDELTAFKWAGTENLSLFFGGELYADGGLIGVMIGGILLSYVFSAVLINREVTINGLDLRKFILMGAAAILLRGPIGAVLALPFVLLCALLVFSHVFGVIHVGRRLLRQGNLGAAG